MANENTHKKLKKPVRMLLGLVFCASFVSLVAMASNYQKQQPIKGFNLQIVNNGKVEGLEKQNLKNWLLKNLSISVNGKRREELNFKRIETQASLNPWVARADVFIDRNNELHLKIKERKPVARIFTLSGNTYFIDSSSAKMPVVLGKSFSVPVFTGVFFVKNDSLNNSLNSKMVFMADLIGKDSFWNAQIEQIIVNADQTFTLIPLLGKNQKILFGDTANAQEKLNNLFAFYKHIPPKIGWNTYRVLDLRYKGQIVASPTLGITLAKPSVEEQKKNLN